MCHWSMLTKWCTNGVSIEFISKWIRKLTNAGSQLKTEMRIKIKSFLQIRLQVCGKHPVSPTDRLSTGIASTPPIQLANSTSHDKHSSIELSQLKFQNGSCCNCFLFLFNICSANVTHCNKRLLTYLGYRVNSNKEHTMLTQVNKK